MKKYVHFMSFGYFHILDSDILKNFLLLVAIAPTPPPPPAQCLENEDINPRATFSTNAV